MSGNRASIMFQWTNGYPIFAFSILHHTLDVMYCLLFVQAMHLTLSNSSACKCMGYWISTLASKATGFCLNKPYNLTLILLKLVKAIGKLYQGLRTRIKWNLGNMSLFSCLEKRLHCNGFFHWQRPSRLVEDKHGSISLTVFPSQFKFYDKQPSINRHAIIIIGMAISTNETDIWFHNDFTEWL